MAVVTVMAAGGGTFSIPFASANVPAYAFELAAIAGQQIAGGTALLFTVDGSPLPAVPAGKHLVMYDTLPIAVALPDTVPAMLFSNATGVTTLTSGAASGGYMVVGDGGIDFTAGAGLFYLIAGNGAAKLTLAPGVGGGTVQLGDGNATINAVGGNNTITTGTGDHVVTLGIGTNYLITGGSNTIYAGPGDVTISAGTSTSDLIFLGSGKALVSLGTAGTVLGGTGDSNISNSGSLSSALFAAGSGPSFFSGNGTVVGGSGPLRVTNYFVYNPRFPVTDPGPGILLFGGSNTNTISIDYGANTIVGNTAGTMTIDHSGLSSLVAFTRGTTVITGSGSGNGPETVIGVDGVLTVNEGSGLFLGAPGGGNHITATNNATIFGVAAGDVLASSAQFNSQQIVIAGGAGAETISGAGSKSTNTFFAGSGPEFIKAGDWITSIVTGTGAATVAGGAGISLTAFVQGRHPDVVMQGFTPGRDFITLINFAAGEAAAALAGAQTVAGSEVLTLSDGTHITFQGITGISAGSIL